ncbi:MAG: helix-turn-helix domain-containing protein [Bacteroidota bacterium]
MLVQETLDMASINLPGVCIIAFFLLFVFRKSNKQLSDYLLVIVNLFLACILVSDVWIQWQLTHASFLFQTVTSFYLFPAFFMYGLLILEREQKIHPMWWWSASVAIGFTVFLLLDFWVFHDYDSADIRRLYEAPPLTYHVFYKGNKLFIIAALWWFLGKINARQADIKQEFSSIEPIRLSWLKQFLWVYMVINMIALVGFLVYNFGLVEDIAWIFGLMNGSLVICIFFLCFNGIRQYTVAEFYESHLHVSFPTSQEKEDRPVEDMPIGPSAKVSTLADLDMRELYEGVIRLLEEDKVFLESQLQIQDLADRLASSPHRISQAINSQANKPFYDLINGYRVEHFKQLLSTPDNRQYTILAMGLDSGFNSKASINRIFKQYTGQSPREFQKAQLLG